MNLNIPQETIDKATADAFDKLITADQYNNPISKILQQEFSWDMQGEGKTEIAKAFRVKVLETLAELMKDPDFHKQLGAVVIDKFAEAAVKDLRNLKERERR